MKDREKENINRDVINYDMKFVCVLELCSQLSHFPAPFTGALCSFRLTSRPICVVVVSPYRHAMCCFPLLPFPRLFMHEKAWRRFELLPSERKRKTEEKLLFPCFSKVADWENIDEGRRRQRAKAISLKTWMIAAGARRERRGGENIIWA